MSLNSAIKLYENEERDFTFRCNECNITHVVTAKNFKEAEYIFKNKDCQKG